MLCIVFRWGRLLEYIPYIYSTYLLVGKEDVSSDWFAPLRSDTDTEPLADAAAPAAAETDDVIEDDGASTSAATDEPRPPSVTDEPRSPPATDKPGPPSPAPRPVNDDEAVDEDLIATVRAISECTIDKYRENPALFRVPLQQYVTNSGKITNDAHLISALHTYGQYNGAGTAARKLCKRARLQAAAQIGVQPTAIARRKVPLGGRRCVASGRPLKTSYTTATKKPRKAAPHKLAQCVGANVALGKTH